MTNTMQENRMISLHKLGQRDYAEHKPMACPVYITDENERLAYAAGWLGAARRHARKIFTESRAKRALFPKTFKPFELTSDKESTND